jgi:hypothetical protein
MLSLVRPHSFNLEIKVRKRRSFLIPFTIILYVSISMPFYEDNLKLKVVLSSVFGKFIFAFSFTFTFTFFLLLFGRCRNSLLLLCVCCLQLSMYVLRIRIGQILAKKREQNRREQNVKLSFAFFSRVP